MCIFVSEAAQHQGLVVQRFFSAKYAQSVVVHVRREKVRCIQQVQVLPR